MEYLIFGKKNLIINVNDLSEFSFNPLTGMGAF